jgi:hypothetical protein
MRAGSRWKIACATAIGLALTAGSIPGAHRWRWHHHYRHRHAYSARHAPADRYTAAASRWPAVALSVDDADALRPGQYVWQGVANSPAPVSMVIDLGRQVAFVYQGYSLVGITTVSTGRRGYATPPGVYPILQKQLWHHSNRYNNAPMPYMQRLTWSGIALHSGGVPGYRQSHGCIHLPARFAASLYTITRVGQIVEIREAMPLPRQTLASATRLPTTAEAVAAMAAMRL